jgi:hypothetical protein
MLPKRAPGVRLIVSAPPSPPVSPPTQALPACGCEERWLASAAGREFGAAVAAELGRGVVAVPPGNSIRMAVLMKCWLLL